jgi:hypothetical protein
MKVQEMTNRSLNQIYLEWMTTLSLQLILAMCWKSQPKEQNPTPEQFNYQN